MAFSLFDISGKIGKILLTCAQVTPEIRLGLLVRCIAHQVMARRGVTTIFSDDINEDVASYYERLGYLYGTKPCEEYDEITELNLYHQSEDPQENNFWEFLPPGYKTADGYRMKYCYPYQTLCDRVDAAHS